MNVNAWPPYDLNCLSVVLRWLVTAIFWLFNFSQASPSRMLCFVPESMTTLVLMPPILHVISFLSCSLPTQNMHSSLSLALTYYTELPSLSLFGVSSLGSLGWWDFLKSVRAFFFVRHLRLKWFMPPHLLQVLPLAGHFSSVGLCPLNPQRPHSASNGLFCLFDGATLILFTSFWALFGWFSLKAFSCCSTASKMLATRNTSSSFASPSRNNSRRNREAVHFSIIWSLTFSSTFSPYSHRSACFFRRSAKSLIFFFLLHLSKNVTLVSDNFSWLRRKRSILRLPVRILSGVVCILRC